MGRPSFSLLRSRRPLVGLVAATTLVAGAPAAATPAATGPAPGSPGQAATWSPGDKDGFGTAIHSPRSKVWYTLNNGTLSEIYYPRIDTEGTRDTQFVVSDGATFTDREDSSTTKRTELVDPRALVYRRSTPPPAASTASPRHASPIPLARRCWSTCGSSRSPASRTTCTSCTTSASG